MVRREATHSLRVQVPPGQAPKHSEAGSGLGAKSSGSSGASKASCGRERRSGPQHKVNAAASTYSQPKGVWEGRAAHVTAKATDSTRESERVLDLPGVGVAARSEGKVWNMGDPPRQPSWAKTRGIRRNAESRGSREGVRGARSTDEGGQDKPLEGRGPALVERATGVSAREWTGRPDLTTPAGMSLPNTHENSNVRSGREPSGTVRGSSNRAWGGPSGVTTWGVRGLGRALVQATFIRPSVSRVRENRMHGLNGGHWKPGPHHAATGA